MPLEILGLMVVAGIGLAIILVKTLVNHEPRLIENDAMASRLFANDYPMVSTSGKWIVDDEKRLAIAEIGHPERAVGMVSTMGSKHITRLLIKSDINSFGFNDAQMTLHLNDFTLPTIGGCFAAKSDRNQLVSTFERLIKAEKTNTRLQKRSRKGLGDD